MSTRTITPATQPQVDFIHRLLAERQISPENLASVQATLAQGLSGKAASDLITWLKDMPFVALADVDTPVVPEGRYAAQYNGATGFYIVQHGKNRWAGMTFVKRLASDMEHRISRAERESVLAQISEDPMAASAAFGHLIGKCGVCGRTLTDEESREIGIGPICINKF